MKKILKYFGIILLVLLAGYTGVRNQDFSGYTDNTGKEILENEYYTTKEDVSLYLYTYGVLPDNFITKKEAGKLGWKGGGLDAYMDGYCIGGDKFGNYEGNLPEKEGRQYYECDIGTMHQDSRGAQRLVYSNDGLIYYTQDHYTTFELLYEDAEILN